MPSALRICPTLSGGASLGAFQAGAGAALLAGLECIRDEHGVDVRVDAIGGASAGSIVGLMVAHALLEGVGGCSLLHEAWVDRVAVDTLLRSRARGPLSPERVGRELPELLEGGRRGPAQRHPLILHVALTGLRGLTYDIRGLRDGPVTGVTFADWKDFRLEPGGGIRQLMQPEGSSPLETVLASASHPGAFGPRVLDRRGDRDAYERQGISNLPRSGWLWYSDGGQIQSEPLGRVLAAARAVDGDGPAEAHRLNLLIDPRSEEPSDVGTSRATPRAFVVMGRATAPWRHKEPRRYVGERRCSLQATGAARATAPHAYARCRLAWIPGRDGVAAAFPRSEQRP